MQRIEFFDYARAIAIIGILLCHCCLAGGEGIGRYLGLCFNTVFFLISAIIMGCKWANNNYQAFRTSSFLFKRFIKIYPPLFLFVLFGIALCLFTNTDFIFSDAILCIIGLGWFGSIPGYGHTWFITGILICYIMFLIISHWPILRNISLKCLLVLAIFFIVLSSFLNARFLPGYFLLILFLCAVFFLYAIDIIKFITRSISLISCLTFVFLINISAIIAFHFNIFDTFRSIAYLWGTLCGCSYLLLFCQLRPKVGKIFRFISALSYEIYLVHHPFCIGPFSLFGHTSWLLTSIVIFIISFILAFLLHRVSCIISSKISKCNI